MRTLLSCFDRGCSYLAQTLFMVRCYDLGVKGQGQIYLESVLQLVTRNPLHILDTYSLWFVDDNKGFALMVIYNLETNVMIKRMSYYAMRVFSMGFID